MISLVWRILLYVNNLLGKRMCEAELMCRMSPVINGHQMNTPTAAAINRHDKLISTKS